MIAAAVVGTSPNYDLEIVTQATLTEVIEQHPLRLTVDELALRIVNNPGDYREVEIAIEAIDDLGGPAWCATTATTGWSSRRRRQCGRMNCSRRCEVGASPNFNSGYEPFAQRNPY